MSRPPVHVFVTGGVASSLGKGLTAASLGMLLTNRGLKVVMQKLDPYVNDPALKGRACRSRPHWL